MQRILPQILVSICLLSSAILTGTPLDITNISADQIVIRYQMPDLEQEVGDVLHLKISDAAVLQEIGKPELPFHSTFISIPSGKDLVVNYSPIVTEVLENIQLPIYAGTDFEAFNNSEFRDSDPSTDWQKVQISEPMIMRDVEIASLTVIPFDYTSDTGELTVFREMEITLDFVDSARPVQATPPLRSQAFEPLYENFILNYETVTDRTEYQTPCILYICGGNTQTNPYLQSLVDWRKRRGYEVHAVATSITGTTTGSIKNYIQNAYDSWENPPEFVCLVGDVGGSYNIPTYFENWSSYNGEGDHPYSQLAGNDIFPEVLIGRISVSNSNDLAKVIGKTLAYEQADYMDNNWFERAALVGDPSSSGISTVISNQYIENIMINYGMDDVNTNFGDGNYANWMRNQLDAGLLYFNYRGYLGTSGFDSGDISNANNGYMTPFATFITCGTGSFSGTSISEEFIRAGTVSNPKGAVASIGTATWGTHTGINNIMDMGFYDGIFVMGVESGGAALAAGKLALYNTYPTDPANRVSIFTHWNNLMGEPALHLWTDTPVIIAASFPDTLDNGSTMCEVMVVREGGVPVEDAFVTLRNTSSSIFISGYTNADGNVVLPLEPGIPGAIDLTITKRNHKPLEAVVIVRDDGTALLLNDQEIAVVDDTGNMDGLLNPGETVNLVIPVRNAGEDLLINVTGNLSSHSDLLTIVESNFTVPGMGPEDIGEFNFEIALDAAALSISDLEMTLQIISGNGHTWNMIIPLQVYGPNIELEHFAPVAGGQFHPGETADFTITVSNMGLIPTGNSTAVLTANTSQIDILNDTITLEHIAPGESFTPAGNFQLQASGDIINGSIFNFFLELSNAEGYYQLLTCELTVGIVSVGDPLGPDEYGYYIYDSNDLDYSLAPLYDWIEVDPDYGGPGTSLYLDDDGNGTPSNQQSAHVTLPFTFTFYGVDYTEITVSSNGWIALGYSEMVSFRNYLLPGPGGPSPIIAAFWDDLETNSGGQVYRYIDAGQGMVVIEWSDMITDDHHHVESFQIILYDAFTPTGDDEIKIQYKEFNNTSNGNMGSGGVDHGAYCTTGIENHLGNIGLTYTYDNDYPLAAMTLGDETALFITTRLPEVLPQPVLNYTPESLEFVVEPGQTDFSTITLSNDGEEGSELMYTVSSSPFLIAGGSDDFGNSWTDSDMGSEIDFEWIDISGLGTQLTFPHNDQAAPPVEIGFSFPFYGEEYTECIVSANGWIGFGEDNTTWQNSSIPDPDAPRPALMPFWDDLNPVNEAGSNSMDGYVYVYGTTEYFVVWFDHVDHWSGEIDGNYNFQAILFPTGEVHFNYDELDGTINRLTVGMQNGSGTDGFQIVHDNTYIHELLTVVIKPQPTWYELSGPDGLSGIIANGQSVDISVQVHSADLYSGDYSALIKISTNVPPQVFLPIQLTITDNPLELGDVNMDEVINILDVVLLVGFIVGDQTPTDIQMQLSDYNQDGEVNVMDIVSLVVFIVD